MTCVYCLAVYFWQKRNPSNFKSRIDWSESINGRRENSTAFSILPAFWSFDFLYIPSCWIKLSPSLDETGHLFVWWHWQSQIVCPKLKLDRTGLLRKNLVSHLNYFQIQSKERVSALRKNHLFSSCLKIQSWGIFKEFGSNLKILTLSIAQVRNECLRICRNQEYRRSFFKNSDHLLRKLC